MKPEKKNQTVKSTVIRKEYKIAANGKIRDWWWDEGCAYHKSRGCRHKRKKQLLTFQTRRMKTWKHNRRCQWKDR
jgi:hypothetical protein